PLKTFAGYFPVRSRSDLRGLCARVGPLGHFIDFSGEHLDSIRARVALIRKGARRVVSAGGLNPQPRAGAPGSLSRKLRGVLARGPLGTIGWLRNAIVRRVSAALTRPSLAVISGEMSIPAAGDSREILKVHSFDYDIYRQVARSAATPAQPYAVFIDQDYCFHLDFVYEGAGFLTTPERYFPAVCSGLREIASSLQLQVRIAA